MSTTTHIHTLLTISGPHAPALKTGHQSSSGSAQRFQDAMTEARPEVAAKPGSRSTAPGPRPPDKSIDRPAEKPLKNSVERPAPATQESAPPQRSVQGSDASEQDAEPQAITVLTEDNLTKNSQDFLDGTISQRVAVDSAELAPSIEAETPLMIEVLSDLPPAVEQPASLSLVPFNGLLGDAELDLLNSEVVEEAVPLTEKTADPSLPGILAQLKGSFKIGQDSVPSGLGATVIPGAAGIKSTEMSVNYDLSSTTIPSDEEAESLASNSEMLLSGEDSVLSINPGPTAKSAFTKLIETAQLASEKLSSTTSAPSANHPALEALTRTTESLSPATRAFVVQTGVPIQVTHPQWSQAVGDKVLWLAAQNISAAEIRLDPPDLGPMHVKVSVNQEQATVSFISPHPMVREALDLQLNRLRDMFAEQGLNLVNVDVSDRSMTQQERDNEAKAKEATSAEAEDDELQTQATSKIISHHLVDHYA